MKHKINISLEWIEIVHALQYKAISLYYNFAQQNHANVCTYDAFIEFINLEVYVLFIYNITSLLNKIFCGTDKSIICLKK